MLHSAKSRFLWIFLFVSITTGISQSQTGEPIQGKKFNKNYEQIKQIFAYIDTHEGMIEAEIFFKEAPNTVANFISLTEKEFYNGLTFHRVIQGFMIQGGDPDGDGSGGPGYTIDDEENDLKHEVGTLAMANRGKNTGGSQFYITHMSQPHLDGRHTIFGKVIKGLDVITRIERGDVIKSLTVKEIKK
jgi:peptidyl-prolyl cis-trans isomerase B (cyclophilin B)